MQDTNEATFILQICARLGRVSVRDNREGGVHDQPLVDRHARHRLPFAR